MEIKLTTLQAFNVMTKFLDDYYEKTLSDDVGSLLGDMSFLQDGCTADFAIWQDWIDAIETNTSVTKLQAFDAMGKFLDNYYKRTSSISKDIENLLDGIRFLENNKTVWETWSKCVDKVLTEFENSKLFLQLNK